jgi:Flp pilus assembly protein TadD
MIGPAPLRGKIMRSLRSGVAMAAIAVLWSSTAFGFNLFGSSDEPKEKPKPAPQAQTQPQPAQDTADQDPPSLAKTIASNLDTEIEKAKTQRALGDYNGAAHALAQMMLVAPDDARVVAEYGKVLVSMGRSDDAVAFLKRALQLSPNDWTLYSAIGAAFDQKNEFDNARTAYQRGLELKPDSAALLNNYAMSRMLAGDLPGAQQLIAQAQALGNDPKIAHNAALMANLRGGHAVSAAVATPAPKPVADARPVPVATAALPAPVAPIAKPAPVKAEPAKAAALTKPAPVKVAVAPVAKPEPVKAPLVAKPEPVKAAAIVAPAPVKAAAVVAPAPVKAAVVVTPAPIKTASLPAAEKPIIVKTPEGRVMMQAVPKDPEAGPVKTAEVTEPAKPEPVKTETAVATSAPRTLASAATTDASRATPDLRSAAD